MAVNWGLGELTDIGMAIPLHRRVLRRIGILPPKPPRLPGRQTAHQTERLDGVGDILRRAPGASVLDIGCNRGLISMEFAWHGAACVHGCDIYEPGVQTAREIFGQMRCESHFVVADLTGGADALTRAFGRYYRKQYDVVLLLAVYMKIRKDMTADAASDLVFHLAQRTGKFLVLRDKIKWYPELRGSLERAGLHMAHLSVLGPYKHAAASIWARKEALRAYQIPADEFERVAYPAEVQ
jgi:SAM-dependent methyltransferase